MKNLRRVITIFYLLILYVYVVNISNFPSNMIVYNNSDLDLKLCPLLSLDGEILASSTGSYNMYSMNLKFGNLPVKQVNIDISDNIDVVPCGDLVGLKLYSDGVMIVGFSKLEDISGHIVSLEQINDLEAGDRIVKINNKDIKTIDDLKDIINQGNGSNLEITVIDSTGKKEAMSVKPIHTGSNEYKLGLWVKDASTGVGTLSFYIPETNEFVALGHGIVDSDTERLINIDYGEITTTDILSINKGDNGIPGEVRGTVTNVTLGKINQNTNFGLFGKLENQDNLENKTLKLALRNEIKTGEAKILSNIEGGKAKEYSVNIEKIYFNNNEDNKSFVIRVTDEELIEKTGGIIRGLSGSPIIQNDKVIGVVTNVLVSDPCVGFGVFSDLIISNLRS